MKQTEQAQALALTLCQGLGIKTITALLNQVPLAQLFALSQVELCKLGLQENVAANLACTDWSRIEHILTYCQRQQIHVVSLFSPEYPEQLKEICNPPLVLFCRGNIALLKQPQIAVVGSRSSTRTGLGLAHEFAQGLSRSGLVVTSGMARGVDGAAHQGALDVQGATIAVLGTGVDVVYPKRHQRLYEDIVQHGLVVSEFLPNTQANSNHFPRRNRIISGLSLGVLLVEAEIKSGSLITARYALEQNKEVFAIPGSIKNRLSSGCHYLIKQGAKLTENIEDILEEVSFFCENSLYSIEIGEQKEEQCPVLENLGFEVTTVDTLTQRTQWPVEQVIARLLDLELEDKVERVLDGYIKLARG
ncbi:MULTISPECIES: DNA-processing protein DprA [Pseudoalteromonas]|uniref:DNA-processing protein DprA n=1 Tax=Pseudoalteromonas TaxID=53246 RepID=UPI000FFF4014|nr:MULTISPECIES: DNA-processing protein DprA [Pseudoalteromonas]NKC20475.1 DNA-protecting protein DprA [Pseudoalteromonas galatheae]RXE86134.1 DNA-protecting protein DprA [Pseudoalteromonas sp. A757]